MTAKQVFMLIGKVFFRWILCFAALGIMILLLLQWSWGIGGFTNLIAAAFCALFIFWANNNFIFTAIKKFIRKFKAGRFITKFVAVCSVIAVIYFSILTVAMLIFAYIPPAENSTVVVLGCMVNGKTPSHMLRTRIDAAYEYLSENPNAVAVLSGGQGPREDISEARAIYNSLTSSGISPDRLYLEEKSSDTDENIRYSMEVIKENNLSTDIAIVTDAFHEMRASIIARKNGVSNVSSIPAHTSLHFIPAYWFREWIAIPVEIVK